MIRRLWRPTLLAVTILIVLGTAYGAAAKRLPLSFWTIPLMLEVRDRIRDHPAAVATLGEEIRVGWTVTGAAHGDETGDLYREAFDRLLADRNSPWNRLPWQVDFGPARVEGR